MLNLLAIAAGAFDLGSMLYAAAKYSRITVCVLLATLAIWVLCLISSSPPIRWIVGFHLFVTMMTAGVIWEQKRGRLREG